jgi:hypothetical protein
MYDDDDYNGGSGLGAAALFWTGYNWGASAVDLAADLLSKPAFRSSTPAPMVHIDEYNALVRKNNALIDKNNA